MTHALEAFILGVVQGITEFLPISSSAHLIVIPWLMGWKNAFINSLTFDVALHFGSLLALIIYFWREWLKLARDFFNGIKEKKTYSTFDRRLVWYLIVATIPGALVGYLFEKKIETVLRDPFHIAIALAVFGIVLYFADRQSRKSNRPFNKLTMKDSIIIGVSQALALVPGVSRSGITMTAALFMGLDREASARFSFLMATPIIFGAAFLKLYGLIHHFPGSEVTPFIWGVLGSAIVSYLAIGGLLKYLKRHSFDIFAGYRVIFGVFLIWVYFVR